MTTAGGEDTGREVRVLLVEDAPADAELVLRTLAKHGFRVEHTRVADKVSLELVLADRTRSWDICISDYSLAPDLDAPRALAIVRRTLPDVPFIVVSGTVSEETAVLVMRAGAHDYISKQQLLRLGPAVERELAEADNRRQHLETERRFRSLISAMNDVVFSVDLEKRYTGLYGRRPDVLDGAASALGKHASEVLPPRLATLHDAAYAKALAGEPVVFDWSHVGADQTTRHYQTSVSPTRDESGVVTGLVGLTRDTTRQQEMQEQLLQSERLAIVGSMTASLTHEINNPLTFLLLNLENLVAESDPVPEALSDAWSAARRVLDIVSDVKLIARAADARHGTVDVCTLLDSTAKLVGPELRHRAQLVKEYGGECPILVRANESRLGQVFLNLIVNAAQAIPAGNVDENFVRLIVRAEPDAAVVEIVDTGVGMPREVVSRLFTPFFTTKPAGVGSGIGLSISKRIVDSLGGQIEVESEVGRGTTFRVTLPGASAGDDAPP